MAARNDITGDSIQTKKPSDAYRDGWDRIFGKNKQSEEKINDDDSNHTDTTTDQTLVR